MLSDERSSWPLRGFGYQMVSYLQKLVLFGGFGFTCGSRPAQPGAEYVKIGRSSTDARVLTNQLHTYDMGEYIAGLPCTDVLLKPGHSDPGGHLIC